MYSPTLQLDEKIVKLDLENQIKWQYRLHLLNIGIFLWEFY